MAVSAKEELNMVEAEIQSSFVARTVELDYADALGALGGLIGQEIRAGSARLNIEKRGTGGLSGAASFSGRLHTGSLLVPSVPVDVVVSPWSATRVEFGISPLGRVGDGSSSYRLHRFFDAAWPLVDAVIDQVTESLSPSARLAGSLQVAA